MITKKIKDWIIEESSTLRDAMIKISDNCKGIIFVVDEGKLIGVLSDGDIRRALIRESSLLTPLDKIMNLNYVCSLSDEEEELIKLSKERRIVAIPIVDKNNNLLGIFFRD